MEGCNPFKKKKTATDILLQCLSLCTNLGHNKEAFPVVKCDRCTYACKDNFIEVRCKNCRKLEADKALPKNEKTSDSSATKKEASLNSTSKNEFSLHELKNINSKVCALQKQPDGTMDLVCSPCVVKKMKKFINQKSKTIGNGKSGNCKNNEDMRTLKDVHPCEMCGSSVKNDKRCRIIRLVCYNCAGSKALNYSRPKCLKIIDDTGNSLKLKWKMTNGNAPDSFVIEIQRYPPHSKWEILGSLSGDQNTEYTVPEISSGSHYRFRVTASNKYGMSPPVEVCRSSKVINSVPTQTGKSLGSGTSHSSIDSQTETPNPIIQEERRSTSEQSISRSVTEVRSNQSGSRYPSVVKTSFTDPIPEERFSETERSRSLSTERISQKDNNLIDSKTSSSTQQIPGAKRSLSQISNDKSSLTGFSQKSPSSGQISEGHIQSISRKISFPETKEGSVMSEPEVPGRAKVTVDAVDDTECLIRWETPDPPPDHYVIKKKVVPDGEWEMVDTVPFGVNEYPLKGIDPNTLKSHMVVVLAAYGNKKTPLDEPKRVKFSGSSKDEKLPPDDIFVDDCPPCAKEYMAQGGIYRSYVIQAPKIGPQQPLLFEDIMGPLVINLINESDLVINWSRVSGPRADMTVNRYIVQRQIYPDGVWSCITQVPGDADNLQCVVPNLDPTQTYKFRVIAEFATGERVAIDSLPHQIAQPPKNPVSAECTLQHRKGCQLSWEPATDGPEPDFYAVEKRENVKGAAWKPVIKVPATRNDCMIEHLTPGKAYNFQVRAINKSGSSKPTICATSIPSSRMGGLKKVEKPSKYTKLEREQGVSLPRSWTQVKSTPQKKQSIEGQEGTAGEYYKRGRKGRRKSGKRHRYHTRFDEDYSGTGGEYKKDRNLSRSPSTHVRTGDAHSSQRPGSPSSTSTRSRKKAKKTPLPAAEMKPRRSAEARKFRKE